VSIVQVIPLGGVGEIGKNCTVVREGDDIVLIDCGLSFPDEDMPGIDIVIPDFTYLKENAGKLRGVFLTHAHEDHVGALSYLLKDVRVPVFCTEFTQALIRQKLEERLPKERIDIRLFKPGEVVPCGALSVEPIRVTHSIPENCAMAVRTTHGIVLFTGDFKFDFTPVDGKLSNITRFAEIGREGVVALMSDSTNVERRGWGPSESIVTNGLREVFAKAKGRILLTTFASNIHRLQQAYEVAAETGRKVAVVGRRMEQNVEICERLKYLKVPKNVRISLQDMHHFKDEELVVFTTGSQGEPMSALVQMSKGTYGRMQVKSGDTLIYSARPIPGNEGAIWRTVNRLFEQGVEVVYDPVNPVHVSGHGYSEELKMMINLVRPYYVAPVHGEPRHQWEYLRMARDMGYPDNRVFTMKNGVPLEIGEKSASLGSAVPAGQTLVDSGGNAGVPEEILIDRTNVAKSGVVVVTVAIDKARAAVAGNIGVMAKGFSGDERVLDAACDALTDHLASLSKEERKDVSRVKHDAADVVRRIIQRRANLRPLVLPIVLEV
jgi:ribonuclease J